MHCVVACYLLLPPLASAISSMMHVLPLLPLLSMTLIFAKKFLHFFGKISNFPEENSQKSVSIGSALFVLSSPS